MGENDEMRDKCIRQRGEERSKTKSTRGSRRKESRCRERDRNYG